MNTDKDQFGRPLDTSDKNEPKEEHATNTVNEALDNIKEEMNSPSNQTFEPLLDTQDQANDFENKDSKDSFEEFNIEESSSTQDFGNDFTPSESEDTFAGEFNVDSTPNKKAENTNDQSTPHSPDAQPLDNSFTDTKDYQPTSQSKLTPDAAAVHEYQVQLVKMMQLLQSQNLQILGLSKKIDDLNEQRLLESKKDNIEEIESKLREREKEKKQETIDRTVVTPPPQPSFDQSSSIKQTTAPQEVKEKTKLQLTFLGGIIFILFFLFIILGMYSYLVLEKILPLSSDTPGYIFILSIIDLYKQLFFWL